MENSVHTMSREKIFCISLSVNAIYPTLNLFHRMPADTETINTSSTEVNVCTKILKLKMLKIMKLKTK